MEQTFLLVAAFVLGSNIGSFLNVVIWRLPRNESLRGRSHCPHCRAELKPGNLFPVISYVIQAGRCRSCRKVISARYPVIEITTGLLFALAAVWISPASVVEYASLLRLLFFIAVLVPIFVIDLEHYLILDAIVLPATVVMFIFNIALDVYSGQPLLSLASTTGSGLAAAAGFGLFFYALWALSRGRWMGFGDVKLSILLGLTLGLFAGVVGFILAFWLGAIFGIVLLILRRKTMQGRLPFGTFLSLASLVAAFYGLEIWKAYTSLIF